MTNTRSKNSRQRGSKTHGWGAMKKHRGAGHRGGRGAAGSGKRGDAKKPSIWKGRAGKHGFTSHSVSASAPITIQHLETHTRALTADGILSVKGDLCTVDLTKAGYTKLLATGKVTKQWNITVAEATPKAIEKIAALGGKVVLPADGDTSSDSEE